MWRAAALLIALTVPMAAGAQPSGLVSDSFTEYYSDRVPVGGKPLVGVVVSGGDEMPAGTALRSDSLSVATPALTGTTRLCMRAKTQDGRYTAVNILRVGATGLAADDAHVAWQTKYASELNNAQLREVAVLAFAGGCDHGDVVPVLMGSAAASGTLRVIVNTLGGAMTAALRDPETKLLIRRAKCTRVPGSARVAFDAVCDFGKVAELQGARPRMLLRLDQVSDDGTQTEMLQAETIRLVR